MSYLVPPDGATDDQIEKFIASLRSEARSRVREMLKHGAPEDAIVDYIGSVESDEAAESIESPGVTRQT